MKCKLTLGFPAVLAGAVSRKLSVAVGTDPAVVTSLGTDAFQAAVLIPFDTDVNFSFVDVFTGDVEALNPLTLSHNEPAPAPVTPQTDPATPPVEPPATPSMAGSIEVVSKENVNDDGTPVA